MLWKTHIRISNEVLRRLNVNLSSDVYSRFKEGVLAPDQWQDFPHHHGKSGAIERNLLSARQYFLQNNYQDAFYHLGIALHYIQDAYTSVISYDSPNNQKWHHNYEQSIEDSEFVYNLDGTIRYFFQNNGYQRNRFCNIASQLSQSIDGKYDTLRTATLVGRFQSQQTGKPIVDLNLALRASLIVAESVLSSRNNAQIDSALEQSLAYHETLLHNAELSTSKEIVTMANLIVNLKSKRVTKSGIIPKLKNGLLGLRVKVKELQLSSKYNSYLQKKHLLEVSSKYKEAADRIINPQLGWYIFSRSELDLNIVKSELIPVQESFRHFVVDGYNKLLQRRKSRDNYEKRAKASRGCLTF
jgi:hypothetical protein